ncbi:MAG: DNA translocase FtsK [Oscillospiraceae bacterium]|nr:DNA translocase FtsK [Oscillospiraceae bacterium]
MAVKMDKSGKPDKLWQRGGWLFAAMTFLSGFLEIMFGGGRLLEQSFGSAVGMLYEEGLTWSGGGILSIVAFPLMHLFGDIGAKILICLLLFVSIMLVTKKSLSDLFRLVSAPFRNLWEVMQTDREESDIIEEYEHAQKEQAIRSEEEALRIAELSPRSRKKSAEPQFLIDVPMQDGPPPAPVPKQDDAIPDVMDVPVDDLTVPEETPKADPAQDAALEELIRKATEQPKKKNKQEQQLEAVLEIADEISRTEQASATKGIAYQMPSLDYLSRGSSYADDPNASRELREKADLLREVLKSFNVEVRITHIARGPSVTRYEVQPAAGVKVSKITSLADDIALNLAAPGVRIEAPIPGKSAIGIEVPNSKKDMVSLRELLETDKFRKSKSKLAFGVGKDIAGNVIIGDIAKMPHMLIAGATGSGKSVCTNSIIMSILFHAAPDEVKLILIDPKIVEFRVYDGIPHLLIPVVTDPKKAAGALNWAVQEMLRRYDVFAENGVRNLEDYNRLCKQKPELTRMPQIVICIDELADLMMTASKEVEDAICRLAQLARAAGMHLIIATQRPTTDIITGLIKANIPSRIALSVKAAIDSRIILDTGGAEKLLGHGDMLYLPSGQPKPLRVQGCYVSTQEIERVVNFIKAQSSSEYDSQIIEAVDRMAVPEESKKAAGEDGIPSDEDDMLERAIEVVVQAGQASTSNLQRRLRLGYARAARIMDELEELGVIGPYEGAKPRRVLMTKQQYEERRLRKNK